MGSYGMLDANLVGDNGKVGVDRKGKRPRMPMAHTGMGADVTGRYGYMGADVTGGYGYVGTDATADRVMQART
jgi:hypothetical protein